MQSVSVQNIPIEKKPSIMIVDDDPDILDALSFVLQDEGYAVSATENGDDIEELDRTDSALPDLIILDVFLSHKDGRVICKALKSRNVTQQIPVIMISAHPGADMSTKAVGANEFLPKPFEVEDLLTLVHKYLT